jgi:hypothetical protein
VDADYVFSPDELARLQHAIMESREIEEVLRKIYHSKNDLNLEDIKVAYDKQELSSEYLIGVPFKESAVPLKDYSRGITAKWDYINIWDVHVFKQTQITDGYTTTLIDSEGGSVSFATSSGVHGEPLQSMVIGVGMATSGWDCDWLCLTTCLLSAQAICLPICTVCLTTGNKAACIACGVCQTLYFQYWVPFCISYCCDSGDGNSNPVVVTSSDISYTTTDQNVVNLYCQETGEIIYSHTEPVSGI